VSVHHQNDIITPLFDKLHEREDAVVVAVPFMSLRTASGAAYCTPELSAIELLL
jgi:hypothetical protein